MQLLHKNEVFHNNPKSCQFLLEILSPYNFQKPPNLVTLTAKTAFILHRQNVNKSFQSQFRLILLIINRIELNQLSKAVNRKQNHFKKITNFGRFQSQAEKARIRRLLLESENGENDKIIIIGDHTRVGVLVATKLY